jgi:hypothetical protein
MVTPRSGVIRDLIEREAAPGLRRPMWGPPCSGLSLPETQSI